MTSEYDKIKEFCNEHDGLILESLGFTPDYAGDVQCCCPIHGGNNRRAFSYRSDMKVWKCWTKHCEDSYGSDLIGLVKAVKKVGYKEALDYVIQTIGQQPNIEDMDLKRFIRLNKVKKNVPQRLDLAMLKNKDSAYFESRGLSRQICEAYETFIWDEPGNYAMHNRYCIPIKNEENEVVGYTGRSPRPNDEYKWLHGPETAKLSKVLFNLNNASSCIKQHGTAVLVEGPLDVLKLVDNGISNIVTGLSLSISKDQLLSLLKHNCKKLYILFDPDEAGKIAAKKLIKKYSIYLDMIDLSDHFKTDPSDFTADDINKLKDFIK